MDSSLPLERLREGRTEAGREEREEGRSGEPGLVDTSKLWTLHYYVFSQAYRGDEGRREQRLAARLRGHGRRGWT